MEDVLPILLSLLLTVHGGLTDIFALENRKATALLLTVEVRFPVIIIVLIPVYLDINECLTGAPVSCPQHSFCNNTFGSYDCACDNGYKKYEGNCISKFIICVLVKIY